MIAQAEGVDSLIKWTGDTYDEPAEVVTSDIESFIFQPQAE